jgi:protein O-mannosyl-transferase
VNRRRKQHDLPKDRDRQPRQTGPSSKTPDTADAAAREVRATWAVCVFLLLAVLTVFGQTVNHGFLNHDDHLYVSGNLEITQAPVEVGVLGAFLSTRAANWHPLTWLSHILDYQVYGLRAGGHHLSSVLLHAAAAIVLFLVLHQMTGDLWPSAFVATVFAIHPLRVESVAWVAERKDVLSGLFFMLTLWAYLGYVRRPFSWLRYLVVIVLFAMGLMSKPMLVTLPFVLLLLDYWPLGRFSQTTGPSPQDGMLRQNIGRLLVEKAPLLLLAAASCVATMLAQKTAMATMATMPPLCRLGNAMVSYVAYLGQFFFPAGLAAYYPHPGTGLPIWKAAAASLLLAGITLVVLIRWRRNPYLSVGWFWYLGMLVPVIGLVQVGEQAMADRYTYLPQIGLGIALAWGAASFARSRPYRRLLCPIAAALAIAILLCCAWRQTAFWHDDETLWNHALDCTDRNHLAHFNVGEALRNRGEIDKAMEHFQAALDIQPRSALIHNNYGIALADRGRTEEAVKHFQAALDVDPNYVEAHCNLGAAMVRLGRNKEAIEHFEDALKIKHDMAEAHYNLGAILANTGRTDEAIEHIRDALNINHGFAAAHSSLAILLTKKGQIGEAVGHYREALRLKPDDVSTLVSLAWLRATCPQPAFRNGVEAVGLAEHAVRLTNGRQPAILDILAAAYAEAGRFPEAAQVSQKALEIARQQNQQTLVKDIEVRLRLYETGSPYRQPPAAAEERSRRGG